MKKIIAYLGMFLFIVALFFGIWILGRQDQEPVEPVTFPASEIFTDEMENKMGGVMWWIGNTAYVINDNNVNKIFDKLKELELTEDFDKSVYCGFTQIDLMMLNNGTRVSVFFQGDKITVYGKRYFINNLSLWDELKDIMIPAVEKIYNTTIQG